VGIYLRLTVTDLLDPPSGGLLAGPLARTTRTAWCRVPVDWVIDGGLRPGVRAALVDRIYGPCRPQDRNRFVVLDVRAKVLSEREARSRPWLGDRAGCYVCGPDGPPRPVLAAEL
jgi:hypothetical protein